MTATSDERRDMARKLRELPIDMYEVEEKWESEGLNTDCHDQTDYYLIYFVLFGCLPADHMHLCDYEELHTRLGHLIEDEDGRTACSECGCTALYMSSATYCPDCGARVVG